MSTNMENGQRLQAWLAEADEQAKAHSGQGDRTPDERAELERRHKHLGLYDAAVRLAQAVGLQESEEVPESREVYGRTTRYQMVQRTLPIRESAEDSDVSYTIELTTRVQKTSRIIFRNRPNYTYEVPTSISIRRNDSTDSMISADSPLKGQSLLHGDRCNYEGAEMRLANFRHFLVSAALAAEVTLPNTRS